MSAGEISFALGGADLRRYAAQANLRGSRSNAPVQWALVIIATVVVFAGPEFVVALTRAAGINASPRLLVMEGILLAVLMVICILFAMRSAQHRRNSGSPYISGERTLRWSDGVIEMQSRFYTLTMPWASIAEVSRNGGLIVLWIEGEHGLAIPERAFADAAACDAFHAFAGSRASGSRSSAGA